MTWSLVVPLSSTGVSASVAGTATDGIRSNWAAIEAWQGVEHYDFTNALSGTHKESIVGVMAGGATSATTSESGALWLDTGSGGISVYTSGGWYNVSQQQFKVRASLTTRLGLAATSNTQLTFNTIESYGDFDTLSAYSTSTHTITLPQSGYYVVRSSVMISADLRNYSKTLTLKVNGSGVASTTKYGYHHPYLTVADILKLNSSDTITVYLTNGDSQIASAIDRDLEVFRL